VLITVDVSFLDFSISAQADCPHFLNAEVKEFIPSFRASEGFETNGSSGYTL